jgi:ribosomal peptide maturation radical SAM protein 1
MRVLFVNMPFSAIRPALGVSLLKGHLGRHGAESRIEYLNLRFAEMVDASAYYFVADLAPPQLLLGDWVFAGVLTPSITRGDETYLRHVQARYPSLFNTDRLNSLRELRRAAHDFIEFSMGAVRWNDYDLVGFTSTFAQSAASLALSKRLKERFPDLLIAFGGANCEGEMGLQLHKSYSFIDFVCAGEADVSFPTLIDRLSRGETAQNIDGVVYRSGDDSRYLSLEPQRIENLDDLPFPVFDDFFRQCDQAGTSLADLIVRILPIETSRGCWWGAKAHCTFCGLNGSTMSSRTKSARRALEEIEFLTKLYATSFIEAVDNILSMSYFKEFLPALAERSPKLSLFYETKSNLNRSQLALLKQAGVSAIQPGIESLDTRSLRGMRKGVTGSQNVQLLKWCRELEIVPVWNILVGFPDDKREDYEKLAEIIPSLHHLPPPMSGVVPIRIDRFSPLFNQGLEWGLVNLRADPSYEFVYGLPKDQIENLAYYFAYDYSDDRDLAEWLRPLSGAVADWYKYGPDASLICVDHVDLSVIVDRRQCAVEPLVFLDSTQAELYRYVRESKKVPAFLQYAQVRGMSLQEAESFLRWLVERRFVLLMDDRVLGLAIFGTDSPVAETRDLEDMVLQR